MKRVSKKFMRMAEIYKLFADYPSLDLSEEALLSMYNHESSGHPLSPNNGYAIGKKFLNLQVTMWHETWLEGLLALSELYDDIFPEWWLDQVLAGIPCDWNGAGFLGHAA